MCNRQVTLPLHACALSKGRLKMYAITQYLILFKHSPIGMSLIKNK